MSSPRPLPAHLLPPPKRAPESPAEMRARQLDVLIELTDLNMVAARDAAHRIKQRDPDQPPEEIPAGADPTLALARATRAVTAVIGLQTRIAAGETIPAPARDDPRAATLRRVLYPLVDTEPDPARRRATRARVDQGIDDALGADLDDALCLADLAAVVARGNGLRLDPAKLRDNYLLSVNDPNCTDPLARLTPIATPEQDRANVEWFRNNPDAPPGARPPLIEPRRSA